MRAVCKPSRMQTALFVFEYLFKSLLFDFQLFFEFLA